MKKTLIALAVLAASGASFAQVTITGNLTMGYQATSNVGGGTNNSSGFGTDTSEINFAATEDLGGGWKAAAVMGLSGADRSMEGRGVGTNSVNATTGVGTAFASGVRGTNASLSLTTPVGVLGLASTQSADYLSGGIAGVGAYYNGFDGKVLSSRTNRDVVSFAAPVGPVTLGVSYQETSTNTNQGLGNGTTGDQTVTGQSLTTYGATYAKGAIAANATYLNFNSKVGGTNLKDQTRLSGAYDFGAAKLGLGMVVTNADSGTKTTDTLLGVVAPMGAATLGANFVTRNTETVAGVKNNYSGTALQGSYALSKRTSVIANYTTWQQAPQATLTAPGTNTVAEYNFLLAHSF